MRFYGPRIKTLQGSLKMLLLFFSNLTGNPPETWFSFSFGNTVQRVSSAFSSNAQHERTCLTPFRVKNFSLVNIVNYVEY